MNGKEHLHRAVKFAARISLAAATLIVAYGAMVSGNTKIDQAGPWAIGTMTWWQGRGFLVASVILWVTGILYLFYSHTLRRHQTFPQWLRPLPGRVVDGIVRWLSSLIIVERDA